MAKYGAIIRKYYEDEIRDYGKQQFAHVENLYRLFLYESVSKGSMPTYSIKGSNAEAVLQEADKLIEKFNLKKVDNGTRTITSNDLSMYDPPIITNLKTGEIIINE